MVVAANLACCFPGAPQHCYFEGVVKGKWPAQCLSCFREGWSYFCGFGVGSCSYSSRCTSGPEEEEVSSRVNTCDSKDVQSEAAPPLQRSYKRFNPCLCFFFSQFQRSIQWHLDRLTDGSTCVELSRYSFLSFSSSPPSCHGPRHPENAFSATPERAASKCASQHDSWFTCFKGIVCEVLPPRGYIFTI